MACRQLGYSGATGITRETPGASPGLGLNNLQCKGNENALGDCVVHWTSGSCGYGFAGVTCSGMVNFLLLTSTIFSSSIFSFLPLIHAAWKVCAYDIYARVVDASEIVTEIYVFCTLFVEKLRSSNKKRIYVIAKGTAEGNIRLRGGSSENEGRVEVFHQGEWGTVCDDNWTEENAHVVCYELGFTSVRKALQSFGPGSGRVWMDQVNCNGSESAFVECPNSGWGNTACTHQEDVGVICSGKFFCQIWRKNCRMRYRVSYEITQKGNSPTSPRYFSKRK